MNVRIVGMKYLKKQETQNEIIDRAREERNFSKSSFLHTWNFYLTFYHLAPNFINKLNVCYHIHI